MKLISWIWTDEKQGGEFSGTILTERIIFVVLLVYIVAMIVLASQGWLQPVHIDLGQFIAYVWLMAKGAYQAKRAIESYRYRQSGDNLMNQMMYSMNAMQNQGSQDPEAEPELPGSRGRGNGVRRRRYQS